jgi:hypothetical protein
MQLQDVADGPQGQDELTRPSQNVLFNEEDGQVAGLNEKLTRHRPTTNIVSRKNS